MLQTSDLFHGNFDFKTFSAKLIDEKEMVVGFYL